MHSVLKLTYYSGVSKSFSLVAKFKTLVAKPQNKKLPFRPSPHPEIRGGRDHFFFIKEDN